MNNDKDEFEPMLNIPSMEELDRQWKEMEAAQNKQRRPGSASGNHRRTAGANGSQRRAAGANGSQRRAAGANGSQRRAAGVNENQRRAGSARMQEDSRRTSNPTSADRGKKRRKKEKKPKRFKKLRMFLKIFFLMLLLIVLGGLVIFYFKYGDDLLQWKNDAKKVVEESSKDTFRASETSIIYASNKKPIAKLRGDKDSSYLNFEDIPQSAIDCMLVTEDREFYEHSGVNLLSTVKAAGLLVKSKMTGNKISRGGSTITQQLAKNVFLSNQKTYERKIREMFYAVELEKKYSKDEIMEFYMNNICFANGHFGLEAASKAYFSKSAKELDLGEIAFLCSIPNRPISYDPLQHYHNAVVRKNRILKQLLDAGKITKTEYDSAYNEKIILNPAEAIKKQDYMTTFAISCATKALMRKQGFEIKSQFATAAEKKAYDREYKTVYEECHSSLYTGGYRIYTSLSNSKQKKLQKSVNDTLKGFTKKTKTGIYKMQGAATCIDNKTGLVVAIVGGRNQDNSTGYTLNRGFQSYRQPGSCFKPVVVYTPQLERDYRPSTIVDDSQFEGGPKNSDGRYLGKIPLRTAVEKSKNVVAWRLFKQLGPKVGLSYVLKMNFAEIVDSDYYPAASLGGLTHGVSTVEMASAYAAIENDGVFRDPTCVTKIKDSDGNVVVDNKKNIQKKQVYEETASRMMTDILKGVLIRGTGAGKGLSNMACAGKTGTTSDKKDGWFCGFTPYYTTTVWVGYDSPQTVSDLYGSTYPLTIWHNFMEEIHANLQREEFKSYRGESSINSTERDDNWDAQNPVASPEETVQPDAAETPEPDVQTPTKAPVTVTKPPVVATKKPVVTKAPENNPNTPAEDIPQNDNTEDIPENSGD